MAEAVVSFVLQNMTHFFNSRSHLLHDQVITDHIHRVFDKFRWMQPFLKNADARLNEGGVRIWAADLRNLVYDVEDVIESVLLKVSSATNRGTISRYFCVLNERLHHHKFVREMEAIHKRMDDISTRLHHYNITTMAVDYSSYEMPGKLQRFYSHVIVEPQVVGLQVDVHQLVARLTDESEESHRVVSICGMGGLGKTTLARKIYNHPDIKTHFDGLAWVSVSQNLQLRNVLQRIIFCLIKDEKKREEIKKLEDSELKEYLHEIQSTTKCLVVVDDIWRNEDWDRLKPAFPTQRFKSKLMLTSRNVQISHHVDPNAFLHRPRLLDDDQSWDLLRMRAAPQMDPRDVEKKEKFGKEMVHHCGGLPLAIVTLGGILVTKETWMEWERVHKDIQSSIKSGKGMGEELQRAVQMILVKSYNDLPYQLKPCFSYLGRFGEDVEIEAETLYQLWIAEGFVLSSDRRVEGETLMEVAESYLAELVHKCMVEVKFEEEESSLRKFRSFFLHDLMRDLALSKAKEEDCYNALDLRQDNDNKLNGDMHLAETTPTPRLNIYYDLSNGDVMSSNYIRLVKKSGRHLRSVLWFNEGEWSMKHSPPIVKLPNFRFLRVLSLEGFEEHNYKDFDKISIKCIGRCICYNYMIRNMFSEVFRNLIHLRYLSLRNTYMLYLPSCIENLEQLQTLDLRVDSFRLLSLPWASNDKMRKMGELQHLYLPRYGIEFLNNKKLGLEGLSKLETLVNFDCKWCQVQDLQKLNKLRKLDMRISSEDSIEETMQCLESKASSCIRYISLEIDFLSFKNNEGNDPSPLKRLFGIDGVNHIMLNRLKVSWYKGELPAPDICNLARLSCLTHLSIFHSRSKGDPMPLLEKLPALRYLELSNAFNIKEMVCSNMGFLQLRVLDLWDFSDLEKWEVEQGSMPNLQKLLIWNCKKLEQLPEGLKFINSLQKLLIDSMPIEFVERVEEPTFTKLLMCLPSTFLIDRIGEMPVEFCEKVRGASFYKVAHVPSLTIK